METDNVKTVSIKYESGKTIVLDQDDSSQLVAVWMKQRKEGVIMGKIEQAKPSLFKRIDSFIFKFIDKLIK